MILIYQENPQVLPHPNHINYYNVYTYCHIDILDFMPKAKDVLGSYPGYNELIYEVCKIFKMYGWEGDGTIRLLLFPPFLKIGMEDTWGTVAWFVKQKNNGISFIASEIPIPYFESFKKGKLMKDSEGFYTATIDRVRSNVKPEYRCYRLNGLVEEVVNPKENETHWLFCHTNEFKDLSENDKVRFKIKENGICELRNFRDIRNTRNIYISSLSKL